jgi:hypothetical protein
MPYYEFYNLPTTEPWPPIPTAITPEAKRGLKGANQFSEKSEEVEISVMTVTNPSPSGWIGSGPDNFAFSIRRRVKDHTKGKKTDLTNIAVGDLLLYRLALMSTTPGWTCQSSAKDRWPKAYLEFGHQTQVVLKYSLERIVIDRWNLELHPKHQGSGEAHETLLFRAWVITQERKSGNPLKISLGNSVSIV